MELYLKGFAASWYHYGSLCREYNDSEVKKVIFMIRHAGISTSIGSFLGSPLDLLKGAIGWITKTIFGLETNEEEL